MMKKNRNRLQILLYRYDVNALAPSAAVRIRYRMQGLIDVAD